MSESDDLDERIRAKLAAAAARRQLHQEHTHQMMQEIARRHDRFNTVARRLIETIVRPRIHRLPEYFDNGELLGAAQAGAGHCVCRFRHTVRFPATTTLDIFACPDDRLDRVSLVYRLEILPIFFQFEGHDQVSFPIDEVDDARAARWVDEKIVAFVDTYLRLEEADEYQRENLVTDPVCGMRINKTTAAGTVNHEGHAFYFCIEECQQRFLQDPARYVSVSR